MCVSYDRNVHMVSCLPLTSFPSGFQAHVETALGSQIFVPGRADSNARSICADSIHAMQAVRPVIHANARKSDTGYARDYTRTPGGDVGLPRDNGNLLLHEHFGDHSHC